MLIGNYLEVKIRNEKMPLNDLTAILTSETIASVFLPFIVIFAILYATLYHMNIFKKMPSIVVSFVLAIMLVMFHVLDMYHPCWDLVIIINNALPYIGIFLLGIVFLIIVCSIIGIRLDFLNKFTGTLYIGILIFIGYAFLTTVDEDCYDFDIQAIPLFDYIIPIALLALALWMLYKIFSSVGDGRSGRGRNRGNDGTGDGEIY